MNLLKLRNRHFLFIDLALLPTAAILALVLRLDASGMQFYIPALLVYIALSLPVKLLVFRWMGLYSRFWHYASVDELLLIVMASGLSMVIVTAIMFGLAVPLAVVGSFPRSIPFIDAVLTVLVVGGPRFAVRVTEQHRPRPDRPAGADRPERQRVEKRVLIVGAGSAGTMIVKEMRANPHLGLVPVGFLDDDTSKHNVRMHGVPVLGGRGRLGELVRSLQVDEVIIAMPTAPGPAIRHIRELCTQAGVATRTIPGLYDILSGEVGVSQIREVQIEDLLRREPVQTDVSAVEQMVRGCRVLVTGAGGSIGSELCRQIALRRPACLILVGHGENSIFSIANELQRLWPDLPLRRVVADVRDLERLRHVLDEHRPQAIFHAAAHKHVPLMEENVPEAITNNVQGTANLLCLAQEYQVERFVLISTDKAVNPTSIMGATKRVAELLVQDAARQTGCPYVAVRFGNVLGSRGSVVPLFKEQIARGGPLTITHPDVRRYFMTIPEAVQLVLQAAALGQGGEVFMLDMGEPVRIVDLAQDLIELSGLTVGRDIEIVYTGLRPGEKLFEELFVQGEEYVATRHAKIFISRNNSHQSLPSPRLQQAVADLLLLARAQDRGPVAARLAELVPEYLAGGGTPAAPGNRG